jgi:hypothetical protein
VVICRRVEDSLFILEVGVAFSPVRVCCVGDHSRASDVTSSVCSLISFCGVVNSCGEIIVYVVYVVSCVRIPFSPAIEYCGCFRSLVLLVLRSSSYLRG